MYLHTRFCVFEAEHYLLGNVQQKALKVSLDTVHRLTSPGIKKAADLLIIHSWILLINQRTVFSTWINIVDNVMNIVNTKMRCNPPTHQLSAAK